MLINVSKAINYQLDFLVERAKGTHWVNGYFCYPKDDPDHPYPFTNKTRPYSTNPSKSFPIIDREQIATTTQHGCRGMELWMASLVLPNDNGVIIQWGPTMLIAAMRCFVVSRLGENFDVPDKLSN